jgi:hypothetical protein
VNSPPAEISPKVAVPALVLAVLGVGLMVAGVALGEDTLTQTGGALLAASGVTGALGYRTTDPAREPTNAERALDAQAPPVRRPPAA